MIVSVFWIVFFNYLHFKCNELKVGLPAFLGIALARTTSKKGDKRNIRYLVTSPSFNVSQRLSE